MSPSFAGAYRPFLNVTRLPSLAVTLTFRWVWAAEKPSPVGSPWEAIFADGPMWTRMVCAATGLLAGVGVTGCPQAAIMSGRVRSRNGESIFFMRASESEWVNHSGNRKRTQAGANKSGRNSPAVLER